MRELEEKRINKEMANIRKKFKGYEICVFHERAFTSQCRRQPGWVSKEKASTFESRVLIPIEPLELDTLPKSFLPIFWATRLTSDIWRQ